MFEDYGALISDTNTKSKNCYFKIQLQGWRPWDVFCKHTSGDMDILFIVWFPSLHVRCTQHRKHQFNFCSITAPVYIWDVIQQVHCCKTCCSVIHRILVLYWFSTYNVIILNITGFCWCYTALYDDIIIQIPQILFTE